MERVGSALLAGGLYEQVSFLFSKALIFEFVSLCWHCRVVLSMLYWVTEILNGLPGDRSMFLCECLFVSVPIHVHVCAWVHSWVHVCVHRE